LFERRIYGPVKEAEEREREKERERRERSDLYRPSSVASPMGSGALSSLFF
jgi:hypothetical protein